MLAIVPVHDVYSVGLSPFPYYDWSFGPGTQPEKHLFFPSLQVENQESVILSLREEIETAVGSYCKCEFTIGKERLVCEEDELLYSGNITMTPDNYSRMQLVQLISRWAWNEPKLNTSLPSGLTVLLRVLQPLEDPNNPEDGDNSHGHAKAFHQFWPGLLLIAVLNLIGSTLVQ